MFLRMLGVLLREEHWTRVSRALGTRLAGMPSVEPSLAKNSPMNEKVN